MSVLCDCSVLYFKVPGRGKGSPRELTRLVKFYNIVWGVALATPQVGTLQPSTPALVMLSPTALSHAALHLCLFQFSPTALLPLLSTCVYSCFPLLLYTLDLHFQMLPPPKCEYTRVVDFSNVF